MNFLFNACFETATLVLLIYLTRLVEEEAIQNHVEPLYITDLTLTCILLMDAYIAIVTAFVVFILVKSVQLDEFKIYLEYLRRQIVTTTGNFHFVREIILVAITNIKIIQGVFLCWISFFSENSFSKFL